MAFLWVVAPCSLVDVYPPSQEVIASRGGHTTAAATGFEAFQTVRAPEGTQGRCPLRPIDSTIGAPTYRLAQYLATQLGEYVGNSPRHVKNSTVFINIIKSLRAGPEGILVSFDVVSLLTMVPIVKALRLLSLQFDENILRLFRHVLNSSFFRFNGKLYEQTDGVAMGSPLFPVIADFFMEHFKETALEGATHKPL
jgi:hypothetical protein